LFCFAFFFVLYLLKDEVGCVRDEFPVVTAAKAFNTLRDAHNKAGRPVLWANIEVSHCFISLISSSSEQTFTWRDLPNNDTSPLIPASYARILNQQFGCSVANVEKIITFTRQGICEPPHSPLAWAPQSDGSR
jgi:hypothetical protein